jgi:hypothetical protein
MLPGRGLGHTPSGAELKKEYSYNLLPLWDTTASSRVNFTCY